jgi:phage tail-like protein
VTQDLEFERWANRVWDYEHSTIANATNLMSLADFRKSISIELYNEAGQLVIAYNVFQCWVSQYQALPELDASTNAVAIQSLTLENEGWTRDTSVLEPQEPSYTAPPAA